MVNIKQFLVKSSTPKKELRCGKYHGSPMHTSAYRYIYIYIYRWEDILGWGLVGGGYIKVFYGVMIVALLTPIFIFLHTYIKKNGTYIYIYTYAEREICFIM